MLERLLGRIEAGRFGRGLAGLRLGWQFQCAYRGEDAVRGLVAYQGATQKRFLVEIRYTGRGARASCSCPDWQARQLPCKHVAVVAAYELGYAAECGSRHRQVPRVGAAQGRGA
ncbi:MAG: SWIM zinc finger family protein [Tindallia sp. MSAO_Bac2]|nr:MAG: SWIM zinc finger family protein [Tindallia sp. MSAO_Bac2]